MSIFFNADLCEIMFVFRFFSEKVRCLLHSSIHFNKILLVNLLKFSFLSSLLLVSTMVTFLASFWDGTHFLFFLLFLYFSNSHKENKPNNDNRCVSGFKSLSAENDFFLLLSAFLSEFSTHYTLTSLAVLRLHVTTATTTITAEV